MKTMSTWKLTHEYSQHSRWFLVAPTWKQPKGPSADEWVKVVYPCSGILIWQLLRTKVSILKEISPGYSLEGRMLKLKLSTMATWCEELIHRERSWCWERLKAEEEGSGRGWDGQTASPTRWTWVLSKLWETVKDRGVWHAAVHGVTKIQNNWTHTRAHTHTHAKKSENLLEMQIFRPYPGPSKSEESGGGGRAKIQEANITHHFYRLKKKIQEKYSTKSNIHSL